MNQVIWVVHVIVSVAVRRVTSMCVWLFRQSDVDVCMAVQVERRRCVYGCSGRATSMCVWLFRQSDLDVHMAVQAECVWAVQVE